MHLLRDAEGGHPLERCEILKIPYLVLHPGAHVQSGAAAGIERVSQALDRVQELTDKYVQEAEDIGKNKEQEVMEV